MTKNTTTAFKPFPLPSKPSFSLRAAVLALFAALTLAAPGKLLAQEAAEEAEADPAKRQVSGTGELGYTQASGNTENQSLVANGEVVSASEDDKQTFGFNAFYQESDSVTLAERLTVYWQGAWDIGGKRSGLAASLRLEIDEFAGFESRYSADVGYSLKVKDSERRKAQMVLGVGYKTTELTPYLAPDMSPGAAAGAMVLVTGESVDEAFGSFSISSTTKFGKNSSFEARLVVQAGEENVFTESNIGLSTQLAGAVGMKVSANIRNNSDPAPGKEKDDTLVSFTLTYKF